MTNNKKQTAVEWFIEQLNSKYGGDDFLITHINEIEKAKEMEKELMRGMYVEGSFAKMRYYNGLEYIDAEQYYNETYGGCEQ
jgi:hypothetical protein